MISVDIKCLTPQEEESFLDILKNRKDAERAYMLYHLMLITGLRLSEALSLNVEYANRTKLELKVKGWTKNKPQGYGLVSDNQNHKLESSGLPSDRQSHRSEGHGLPSDSQSHRIFRRGHDVKILCGCLPRQRRGVSGRSRGSGRDAGAEVTNKR